MSEAFGAEHQRIGNQQREEAINALNDHFAAGRVDIGEYENRVSRATNAQTYSDLALLFSDLPHPHPTFLAPATPPPFPTMSMPPPPAYTQPPTAGYPPPPTYAVPPPTAYGHNVYAPYGYDPIYGLPLSDKSKIVAGLLQLFLGGFGVGRFYIGHTGMGIAQLLTCGGCGIWALIDAIILLVNGGTDAQGRRLRD